MPRCMERSTRWTLDRLRLLRLAAVLLLALAALQLSMDGVVGTVEKVRIMYDRWTCTPRYSVPPPRYAELATPECHVPRSLPDDLPTVYVALPHVEHLWQRGQCDTAHVDLFTALITTNVMGNRVMTPDKAAYILIPYPEKADNCQEPNSIDFDAFWRAVEHLSRRNNFIIYCTRPWMERTHFGMETRDFLKRYPRITLFSPEIKNVDADELRDSAKTFRRHIVVPQAPLDAVLDAKPLQPGWQRPYAFCFQGTLLNDARVATAQVLADGRNDSVVAANCRYDRVDASKALRNGAAMNLYALCKFCPTPTGDSLSDTRFFDAMRAGCIPISYEELRPLPFVHSLDYSSALLQRRHDASSLQRDFERYMRMSEGELMQRRLALAETARRLSFSPCYGYAGLAYALEELKYAHRDDLWGFSYLAVSP